LSKHSKKFFAQKPNPNPQTFQVTATGVHFSGPLPPPDVLIKYNDAHPGAADRILKMAETQVEHRQGLERSVVEANCRVQKSGPIYGFVICMTAILGGVYLIRVGDNAYGLAAIISALASLAFVFVFGKRKQAKELKEKSDEVVRQT
jgi:uncharacterized membrane protein